MGVEERTELVRAWVGFGGEVPVSEFVARTAALAGGFFATVDMSLSAV